ncbi:MAG: EAL domain-containing protein [Gammaproteobacteria bacterium]|nr:EAL domain-containing protein [Gammaproteobacteria bacterium]
MNKTDLTAGRPAGCRACVDADPLGIDFTMAFQPIVNPFSREVFAYEALVRGVNGEGAPAVLARVNADNRYAFDQACRVKAIQLAASLGVARRNAVLSINFLPNAVYRAETCIQTTLKAARQFGFPTNRLMFEVTEGEQITDRAHLQRIFQAYKRMGFITAIDDFGAGYAGLNLLSEFQPDVLKIDMELTRNIHTQPVRQAIVRGIVDVCRTLGIKVIAEGIETLEELEFLQGIGVRMFQGYLFARPEIEALPEPVWPDSPDMVPEAAMTTLAMRVG